MGHNTLHVTVLGTGTSQGVPVIGCDCRVCQSDDPHDKRLRTSIFISYGGTSISVDIGPDFRQQMLTNRISDVDAVLLTHEHDDHVSGLDDIRPINFRQKKNIPLYGLSRVVQELRSRYRYIFDTTYDYSGKPRVDLIEIDSSPLKIGAIAIQPIEVMHGNLDILGYRFGDFAYVTDAKTLSDKSLDQLQGLDVLIINALHRSTHYSHMNLKESLLMIERIKPGKAYLTHLSHAMGLAKEVEQELPDNVFLAFDGQRIEIDCKS